MMTSSNEMVMDNNNGENGMRPVDIMKCIMITDQRREEMNG